MTDWDDLKREPYRFDLFRVLRELERGSRDKPRIGDNTVVGQEIVSFVQDPFLEFPPSNIYEVSETAKGTPRLHTRFLGFFGPQGALPLSTTLEAHEWAQRRDESFARFANIFLNRFIQLFFRAWSDSKPISQHDRPDDDRFARYVGTFAGIGTDPFAGRDAIDDIAKLPFAGLVAPRVKSARRLAQLIGGVFGLDVTIVERIGSWLMFEPGDRMGVGTQGSSLGVDSFLGNRSYSINDKFRISIKTTSLDQYRSLLPDGAFAEQLADLVFFYVGYRYEYDVELALPASLAPATRLGSSGQLGWTAWMAPPSAAAAKDSYLNDARFDLSERRRVARETERARHHFSSGGVQ